MRRIFAKLCIGFVACSAILACKPSTDTKSEAQNDTSNSAQPDLKIMAADVIFSKSGLNSEYIVKAKELVSKNYNVFKASVEENKQRFSQWPQATPEQKSKIVRAVFETFTTAFIPLAAPIFVAGNTAEFIAKVKPNIDNFLNDIEKLALEKLKNSRLTPAEQAAVPQAEAENLVALLDAKTDLTAMYAGGGANSGIALTEGTFEQDFKKAFPNSALIVGLAGGVLATLIGVLVGVAATPALTVGAIIGVGWVCIVAIFRAGMLAIGAL